MLEPWVCLAQEADFAASPFAVTAQRALVVDYMTAFTEGSSTFMLQVPQEDNLTLYIKPFQVRTCVRVRACTCACVYVSVSVRVRVTIFMLLVQQGNLILCM